MKRFSIAMAVLGILTPFYGGLARPASAAPGDAPAQYHFTPGEDVIYEISVKTEASTRTTTTTGYLLLHPRSVDAATGQTVLTYSWAVTKNVFVVGESPTTKADDLPGGFFTRAANGKELTIDARGAVVSNKLPADSPNLDSTQGPPWALMLQPLPPTGQSAWTTDRQTMLYHDEKTTTPGTEIPSPAGFPRLSFRGETTVTRVETPAQETISYAAGTPAGDVMTITRKYHLATLEKIGDAPINEYIGLGKYDFNQKTGVIEKLDWDVVLTHSEKNLTVRTPISVRAHRLTPADIPRLKTEAAATAARDQEQDARAAADRAADAQRYAPTLPAAEEQAKQLKAIEAGWHNKGEGKDTNDTRHGRTAPTQPIVMKTGDFMLSQDRCKPPFTVKLIVFSAATELHIRYLNDQLIFNPKEHPADMQFETRTTGLQLKTGEGLPAKQWAGIEFTVTPTEAIVYVNGREIARAAGDNTNANNHLILQNSGGPLDILSMKLIAE